LLDGAAVVAVALVAGASPETAALLGLAMTALQAAIGALNDLVDAPHDAGSKPGKPVPAGLVSRELARTVIAVAGGVGLALTAVASPAEPAAGRVVMIGLALSGLGIGASYDLRAKGTAWSWLPFAVGLPLLPVFAWFGATGSLPTWFAVLVPMAGLAGAGLAVANARADLERDREAGVGSVAVRLGPGGSWLVGAGLLGGAAAMAVGWLIATGTTPPMLALVASGLAVIGSGIWLGRAGDPARRERAWQLEAIGTAVVAVGWLASVAS
jgi:4-hydroxybenzoate polyprenyltransferase